MESSKYQNDSQESQKILEKPGENETIKEKKMQDFYSEFPEHSQNSRTEPAVKTFEIRFAKKPMEKRSLLGGSESREDSRKSQIDPCVEITEHKDLREIKLPWKPKQLQQLQKNDTYCRDMGKEVA